MSKLIGYVSCPTSSGYELDELAIAAERSIEAIAGDLEGAELVQKLKGQWL